MANDKETRRGISIYIDGQQVENSVKGIQSEMRKLKKEIDKCEIGSEQYVAATKKYRELNGILKQHKMALGQVADATKQATAAGEGYANEVARMLGVNNKFASSLMSLGGGGNMFGNLKTAVSAFGQTLMGLMANPAFLAIAGFAGVGAAFKFWYDYNEGLEEATRLTKEFLGVSGDELVVLRSDIQAVADTYGKDYKSVLQAVDGLTAQYGITAGEALKVVKDGFVAGSDANGTFLEQLNQYSASFKDIGIGADELAALISQTRSGIFSEQGMDAIQMAGKRIREMGTDVQSAFTVLGMDAKEVEKGLQEGSISTFDAIQMVAEKLKSLDPQSKEVGEVLKDVFGKQGAKAGYTLVTSFADVSTSIEECKEVTGEFGKAQEEYIDAQAELNTTVASMFDMTQSGFGEMTLQLKTIATKWLIDIARGTVDIINWFIDLYNKSTLVRVAIAGWGGQFKLLWAAVKVVCNSIMKSLKGVGISIKGLMSAMDSLVHLDFEGAKNAISKWFDDFKDNYVENLTYAKDTMVGAITDTINDTSAAVNKRLKPITIPVKTSTEASTTGTAASTGGGDSNTKAKAETDKALKERLKKEEAAIETEIKMKEALAKKEYAEGKKSKEEYNDAIEDLELERVQRLLQINGLDEARIADLQNKMIDFSVKARNALDDIDTTDSSSLFETTKKKLDDIAKTRDESVRKLDRANKLGIISEQTYADSMAAIDKKFNADTANTWDEYMKQKEKANGEEKKKDRDLVQQLEDANISVQDLTNDMATSLGQGLADSISGDIDSVKSALKSLIITVLSAMEKMMLAHYVGILGEDILTKGWAGVASALAKQALITTAFEAAKAAVNNFATGGYTGQGAWNESAGVVHKGEFVANSQAVANPAIKSVLDVINNAQQNGNVKNLTTEDLLSLSGRRYGSSVNNDAMVAMLISCNKAINSLNTRLQEPIVSYTYATGKGGVNEAQELVKKMKQNIGH